MSESLLKISHLTHRFGGLQALTDINVDIKKGSINALIGPNGAGKTTVFNLVSGFYVPSQGDILFDGTRLNGLRPHKIADLQVGRTFQNIRLWSDMTVLDNICIAQHSRLGFSLKDVFFRTKKYKDREAEIHKKSWELLEKFSLADTALDYPKNLPYGIQRRVEIARALSLEPKLLMLDEPAAGLSTSDLDGLISYISWIHDTFRITIWMIEHQMQVVNTLADRIKVINFGKELAEGSPEEIQKNPSVIEAYLGNSEIKISDAYTGLAGLK
ncbi:MAG: ABC transporter ATP-binding protein [Treponema sp.]|nr:ABC transporter ATP-binding protein [Treponema sp.]